MELILKFKTMGKNGKNPPVFPEIIKVVNANVGKVITSEEMLLGKKPDRGSETSYLYKLVKLGYVEPVNNGAILNVTTKYKILRAFTEGYNTCMLMDELRIANGHVPKKYNLYTKGK